MTRPITPPPSIVVFAIAGAMLFVLGGLVTTNSTAARITLAIAAVGLAVLGGYAIVVTRRTSRYARELDDREAQIVGMRAADSGLRTRMAFTLRDPLTSIVSLSDRMVNDPSMDVERRTQFLKEIRTSAREVEGVLADLALDGEMVPPSHAADGVVLLDQEAQSVMATATPLLHFRSDLAEARAWADSAQVRQIMRTVFKTAEASGCRELTVKTEERMNSAVVTVSAPGHPIPIEAIAALTGNAVASDIDNPSYIALREAADAASAMRGSIGYTEIFGAGHVVVEFERAVNGSTPDAGRTPTAETTSGPEPTTTSEEAAAGITFASAMSLRPERPSAAIRFG